MASPTFNNVDDAIRYLVKNTNKIMGDLANDVIIPTIQESIDEVVYNAYKPSSRTPEREYKRRMDNGGLRDKRNFDTRISIDENVISIIVQNMAKPNTTQDGYPIDDEAKRYNQYRYLDWIVVHGDSYTWENSNIYKQQKRNGAVPRDFYTHATNVLRAKLPLAIAKKFKQLGLEIDYQVVIR